MTIDLDSLEAAAKAATPGPWEEWHAAGYPYIVQTNMDGMIDVISECRMRKNSVYIATANPAAVLELIAELRKARAERDWAVKMVNSRLKFRICPTPERHEECHKEPRDTLMPQENCRACWLKAAREAVEGKQ